MKNGTFPIINRSSRRLVVGLEPEGDTISLEVGEICEVELDLPLAEASVEVVVEDEVLSVYAMCWKRAVVSKAETKE